MNIPLAIPKINGSDIEAVQAVLQDDKGRLALGPHLQAFEDELAAAVGCKYAVAVNSGTSALHLIIRALGIGTGDEVMTASFCCLFLSCVL
jgi:perosamine synthetase